MRAKDFVKNNIAYHETLNPRAWARDQLRPEVKKRLLEIAEIFVNYLELPNFEVLDVVLAGSMANYNYTKYSDFDLHVVTRYSDLDCDDLAEAFYQAKKRIWNDAHDIMIYGHEVELYVEDEGAAPVSGGIYSVLDDKWINEPDYDPPAVDDHAVNSKVEDLIVQIKHTLSAGDSTDITRVISKVRNMRQAGLDAGGEFSTENLAFKVLRNLGYIDRLHQAYTRAQDQELSL